MTGVISAWLLENTDSMEFMVDLRVVFERMGGFHLRYEWLVTDLEYIVLSGDPVFMTLREPEQWKIGASQDQWINGADLDRLVENCEIQWVWAVFSGFLPKQRPAAVQPGEMPSADGNPDLWKPEPRIQHPMAKTEIVCWDSTSMLFLTRDLELGQAFKAAFSDAQDLAEYNRRFVEE